MLRLTVEAGEPAGAVFELGAGESTLGRSRTATIRLPSPDISALHARIRTADDRAYLENTSQFGTRVDEAPVAGAIELLPGQRIAIGKVTVLRFSREAGAAPQAPRPASGAATDAPTGEHAAPPATRALDPLATRAMPTGAVKSAAADRSDDGQTGALSRADLTRGAAEEASEEGATRAMQTRAAAPEEIEHLRIVEQKRSKRRIALGIVIAIPILLLPYIFRPRTPPPETEIEWPQDETGATLYAYEPAASGGIADGGYDLLYPGNGTFKKTAHPGGVLIEGWIGRKRNVPMRLILEEEVDTRFTVLGRTACVEDWIQQTAATDGHWNFDKPSSSVSFFGTKNGVPYTRVAYQRDGGGASWYGIASIIRYGPRRISVRAEAPVTERARAEKILSARLLFVSEPFEYGYWEAPASVSDVSEAESLYQARTDLARMAPATWAALETQLAALLAKATQSGNAETAGEALRLLTRLRERQALWFNSQQLAFDASVMQGDRTKASRTAEFTKAVFSNMDDQRYYTVRKWKVER